VRLDDLYRVSGDRSVVVPNGVDTAGIRFTGLRERRNLRARLRMERELALFVGSWHHPNVVAARRIFSLARELTNVAFAIVGSVAVALAGCDRPPNVQLYGVVSEELKQTLLAVASVALNPMSTGSGTNMKMLDYLAAGVPVVTTEIGARGLRLDLGRDVHVASRYGFAEGVVNALRERPETAEVRLRGARHHVEEHFDWSAIARGLVQALRDDRSRNQPANTSSATA
jgi:glycosyltransferase involved in cell wall biosynthesis